MPTFLLRLILIRGFSEHTILEMITLWPYVETIVCGIFCSLTWLTLAILWSLQWKVNYPHNKGSRQIVSTIEPKIVNGRCIYSTPLRDLNCLVNFVFWLGNLITKIPSKKLNDFYTVREDTSIFISKQGDFDWF